MLSFVHLVNAVMYFSYVLCIGEWGTPSDVGERMPPTSQFAIESITNNRAIIFGGIEKGYSTNSLYIFDIRNKTIVSTTYVILMVIPVYLVLAEYKSIRFNRPVMAWEKICSCLLYHQWISICNGWA